MIEDSPKSPINVRDNIVAYYPDGSTKMDMDNILTVDKIIYSDILLLTQEGNHFDVVRKIAVWDKEGYVYLKTQDQKCQYSYQRNIYIIQDEVF